MHERIPKVDLERGRAVVVMGRVRTMHEWRKLLIPAHVRRKLHVARPKRYRVDVAAVKVHLPLPFSRSSRPSTSGSRLSRRSGVLLSNVIGFSRGTWPKTSLSSRSSGENFAESKSRACGSERQP